MYSDTNSDWVTQIGQNYLNLIQKPVDVMLIWGGLLKVFLVPGMQKLKSLSRDPDSYVQS